MLTPSMARVSLATPGHRGGGHRNPFDHWAKAQSELASVFYKKTEKEFIGLKSNNKDAQYIINVG